MENYLKSGLFGEIRLLVLDVDGVVTDGTVYPMENGEMVRPVNSKDSYALQLARKVGLDVAVISGGFSPGLRIRLEKLGVERIFMSIPEKLPKLKEVCAESGYQSHQVAYMGDDIPDIPCMQFAGLSIAPADAADDVLHAVDYVTQKPGGRGAIREAVERILRVQKKWYVPAGLEW